MVVVLISVFDEMVLVIVASILVVFMYIFFEFMRFVIVDLMLFFFDIVISCYFSNFLSCTRINCCKCVGWVVASYHFFMSADVKFHSWFFYGDCFLLF